LPPTLTVKASWDPEAMVWYTAYSDLPGLNLEADTIDELRDKLPGDGTGTVRYVW